MADPVQSCSPGSPPASPRPAPTTSDLCRVAWRRHVLTGLFVDSLRAFFSDPTNLDPGLRRDAWTAVGGTGLVVTTFYDWNPSQASQRPTLIVKPNKMQNQRLTVGDSHGLDENLQEIFYTRWVGSHTVFAVATTGGAAEILAGEAAQFLSDYGPRFRALARMRNWQVMDIDAPARLKEGGGSFVVPLTTVWAYEHRWRLSPQAIPLRKISFRYYDRSS